MTRYLKHTLVLLVAAALLSAGIAVGAGAGKARPVAVAVIDVQKILGSLSEKTQVEADISTKRDRIQQEIQERKQKIEELTKDLETLAAPGSPSALQKQEELGQKAVEMQTWLNWQQQKIARENLLQMERLYRKIVESAGQVAKENSFDIVFYKEGPLDLRGVKPEEFGMHLLGRKVLFAAEDLDLTDMVIQKMNNDYKNMAAPKP